MVQISKKSREELYLELEDVKDQLLEGMEGQLSVKSFLQGARRTWDGTWQDM